MPQSFQRTSESHHKGAWPRALDCLSDAIGHTPLIRLRHISAETRCNVFAKAEFLNPGGSIKDRAAAAIISDAKAQGLLLPGGVIVEGTAGNTGIGLTMVAKSLGYRTIIVMPETQSAEKIALLRMLGAELQLVPAKPYRDPGNYIHLSRELAQRVTGAFWANQFDNRANREGHRQTTAREIWEQTDGKIDAFTCACGTGGTLSGVALGLRAFAKKNKKKSPDIILADPEGSGLYSWVKEGKPSVSGSSVMEGIGQSRVTGNLEGIKFDDAERISDTEALEHIFALQEHEGLCVGGSSGINVASAARVARRLGPGNTVVTILCDSGTRYQSKLFNVAFLKTHNLPVPSWL